jgi:hypothetical protein
MVKGNLHGTPLLGHHCLGSLTSFHLRKMSLSAPRLFYSSIEVIPTSCAVPPSIQKYPVREQ